MLTSYSFYISFSSFGSKYSTIRYVEYFYRLDKSQVNVYAIPVNNNQRYIMNNAK